MNSEFSSRNGEFYHERTGRNFQFNNRNNFRRQTDWQHALRGVQKAKKKWLQKRGVKNAQSQAAARSFATASQYRPFTPKPPFNLTITIPNFSAGHSSNPFRFRNSSGKSVRFTPAPAGVFPRTSSCFTEHKNIKDDVLKSNETGINEDVQYLYTVQTKGGEHVEVVDLSEESSGPTCSNETSISDHHFASDVNKSDNDRMVLKTSEKETIPSSMKQDAVPGEGRKRKKSSEDLHCDICESEYEFLRSRGEEIFRARCGHMFCQLCLRDLNPYKCPECNIFLQKLLKVFF